MMDQSFINTFLDQSEEARLLFFLISFLHDSTLDWSKNCCGNKKFKVSNTHLVGEVNVLPQT